MDTETLNTSLVILGGLNILVLLLALGVVGKITRKIEKVAKHIGEIEKLRQALTLQSEELASLRRLSLLPAFVARLKPDESGSPIHRLFIKNVGSGIAMNIEIARLDFVSNQNESFFANPDIDGSDSYHSGYSVFQPIQSLGPNSEQVVRSFNYPSDPDQASEMIRHYGYTGFDFLSLIDEDTPLHFDFQDVEGNKYHQVITRKGDIFAPGPVESMAIIRTRTSKQQKEKYGKNS